jgi:hypothetical protein
MPHKNVEERRAYQRRRYHLNPEKDRRRNREAHAAHREERNRKDREDWANATAAQRIRRIAQITARRRRIAIERLKEELSGLQR